MVLTRDKFSTQSKLFH